MRTSKIGFFTISATAPIVEGEADWTGDEARLEFGTAINEVKSGNGILDREVANLVNKSSDGILRFTGAGHVSDDEVRFEGTAICGTIEVPLVLTGQAGATSDPDHRKVAIKGTATFEDISLPLPGFARTKNISVTFDGEFVLERSDG